MTKNEIKKCNSLLGSYKVKSPYHKNKFLPFDLLYTTQIDNGIEVYTEEYKGRKCYPIKTTYELKSILKLINKKVIIKI